MHTMNNRKLNDDSFGGSISLSEEMETCEDLVPCDETPEQESTVSEYFICKELIRVRTH